MNWSCCALKEFDIKKYFEVKINNLIGFVEYESFYKVYVHVKKDLKI